MCNRCLDGLGIRQPCDESMYAEMGQHLAEHGYRKTFALTTAHREAREIFDVRALSGPRLLVALHRWMDFDSHRRAEDTTRGAKLLLRPSSTSALERF
jgi:hypothetical protein